MPIFNKLLISFLLAVTLTTATAGSSFAWEAAKPKAAAVQYITLEQLQELCTASRGKIDKIYIHWTAEKYKKVYPAYHINITDNGKLALTCKSLEELKAHTWHRNTRAVGISICACHNARITDLKANPPQISWGKYPPTQKQIDMMAKAIAVMSTALAIPIKQENIMTHYEAAVLDQYTPWDDDPDCRWDFLYIIDHSLTDKPVPGGELIRNKARWYQTALISSEIKH